VREPVLGAQQRAQAQLKVQERVPLAQGLEQAPVVHKAKAQEPALGAQARLKVQEREPLAQGLEQALAVHKAKAPGQPA